MPSSRLPRSFASALALALGALLREASASSQPRQQRWELEIPRVTVEELEANKTLRSGLHAYVLQGFVNSKWNAMHWSLDYLNDKIAFEWVDYYAENMDSVGKKPFLFKFGDALPKFLMASDSPRYMQLRLSRRGWERLKKDFSPKPVPDIFWDDDGWINDCMRGADGKPDKRAIDNFFVTQQWKFLLIGEKGTSMFFHKDGTASSSWQAQIVGRKRWTLCPNSESHLLSPEIDTFQPDYKRFPRFAEAHCGQVTVSPGELLYYPGYWWHHTYQFETPSIGYTGALVGVEADRSDVGYGTRKPHEAFLRDVESKCRKCWKQGTPERLCDDISLRWPGAAPPIFRELCDTYLPACYRVWDTHATSLHDAHRKHQIEQDAPSLSTSKTIAQNAPAPSTSKKSILGFYTGKAEQFLGFFRNLFRDEL